MAERIVSGQPYQVVGIDHAVLSSLWDLTGPRTITLTYDKDTLKVTGTGVPTEDFIRFYENGPDGRDLRIWQILQSRGGFSAVHQPTI